MDFYALYITDVALNGRHFVRRATKWRILAFRRLRYPVSSFSLALRSNLMMIQISETLLYGGNVSFGSRGRVFVRYIQITVCPWRVVHSSGNQAVKQRLRCHRVCYTTLTCLLWWDANDISRRFRFRTFWYPRSSPSLSIWISQFSEIYLDEKELIVN